MTSSLACWMSHDARTAPEAADLTLLQYRPGCNLCRWFCSHLLRSEITSQLEFSPTADHKLSSIENFQMTDASEMSLPRTNMQLEHSNS